MPTSRDFGEWARYVVKVFDEPTEWIERADASSSLEWTEEVVYETPAGRRQVKFQVAREAGRIRQIEIEQVRLVGGVPQLDQILRLDRDGAQRLIDVVTALQHVPVAGGESTTRIDDQTLRDFFADPDAMARLYERDPERIRELIESDASAEDVVAIAHRRDVVERFRELLTDADAFQEAQRRDGGGPERVWQDFLEANPWILGISLAAQLLTSWDPTRLEQLVAGPSITGPGKRVDALLETSGRIRALVFAEIKHHRTNLLASEYRSGCWTPSGELTGAVVQAQQTVDIAVRAIGAQLSERDEEGAETGDAVQVVRPRSFVIAGQLDQLRGATGVHTAKYRSFELYRRNLYEPEIVTFDELLARAEWHISLAERGNATSI
ncbi:MAG: hypothetical protein QOG70_2696 [Solirubrobacteraceae bacterium]|nr:hypothetical protein [Solirubrobacteraceae bacterium]